MLTLATNNNSNDHLKMLFFVHFDCIYLHGSVKPSARADFNVNCTMCQTGLFTESHPVTVYVVMTSVLSNKCQTPNRQNERPSLLVVLD